VPTYYNTNTQQKIFSAESKPRLESLPQWKVVADDDSTAQAAERARAEKESIEDSAKGRTDQAQRYYEQAQQVSADSAKSRQGGNVNVTLASTLPDGYQSTEGVLARAKGDQQTGRLQIGPDPDRHPRTTEELEAKAAEDSARIAALKPEQSSVLNRAGVDDGIPDPDDDTDGEPSGEEPDAAKRPTKSAKVAEWRAYAVDHHQADQADVDAMTRDELIARYGQ
jgi:hypothetical protein